MNGSQLRRFHWDGGEWSKLVIALDSGSEAVQVGALAGMSLVHACVPNNLEVLHLM